MKITNVELAVTVEYNGKRYTRFSDDSWFSERDLINSVILEDSILESEYKNLVKSDEESKLIPFGSRVEIVDLDNDPRNGLEGVVIGANHDGYEAHCYTIFILSQVSNDGNIIAENNLGKIGFSGYPTIILPRKYVKYIGESEIKKLLLSLN